MDVIIRPTAESAEALAAQIIADALKAKPNLTLGLATGATMENVYHKLADMNKKGEIDFSLCKTFNLDEYVGLPAADRNSYRYYMNFHLFDRINIDKRNTLAGFNNVTQIYAESDILLDREKLPQEVYSWLKNHQEGRSLFNTLRTAGENLMCYRRSVKDEKRHSGTLSLSNGNPTKDTLEWLLSQRINCAKDSDQYKNLLDFINGLPDDFVGMPFFPL